MEKLINSFWKNYGRKHREKKTFHNRKNKELLSIRTKFSYYKVFKEKLLAIEMKKTE